MPQRILPTNDLAFKKTFCERGNEIILQGLIGDFFGIRVPVENITITTPYSIHTYQELFNDKEGIEAWATKLRETVRDVSANIQFADFIAELQIHKEAHFLSRCFHYAFEKYISNYNQQDTMIFGRRRSAGSSGLHTTGCGDHRLQQSDSGGTRDVHSIA